MTEPTLLGDAALGNIAAILPGTALADGTGGIRPDPDARPIPKPPPQDPERPERPAPAPVSIPWDTSMISVTARVPNDGLEGYAQADGKRRRISPGVIHVARGGTFSLNVYYHVDAEGVPRPEQPFRPPQVGLQWYYTSDGGSRTDTSVHWDPAPQYSGPGAFLMPFFDPVVFYAPEVSGWLTVSGRIDDVAGAAEFDDTIRVLVAT
jgi:hypothetical protein